MGGNFWSHGVDANRNTLETFLRYHHKKSLPPRRVEVDERFHPSTMESYSP